MKLIDPNFITDEDKKLLRGLTLQYNKKDNTIVLQGVGDYVYQCPFCNQFGYIHSMTYAAFSFPCHLEGYVIQKNNVLSLRIISPCQKSLNTTPTATLDENATRQLISLLEKRFPR